MSGQTTTDFTEKCYSLYLHRHVSFWSFSLNVIPPLRDYNPRWFNKPFLKKQFMQKILWVWVFKSKSSNSYPEIEDIKIVLEVS